MRYEVITQSGVTLVAQVVGDNIENFVIVEGRPVFANKNEDYKTLGVRAYKKSKKRGMFFYVTYADVLKCNIALLQKLEAVQDDAYKRRRKK